MQEKKQKVFTYKLAVFDQPESAPTLKQALTTALTTLNTIGNRRESLAPLNESPIYQVIGEFKVETEFLFGVLMHYIPGTNPAYVVNDADAEQLTVEQIAPPETAEGKRRELLDSMLFFAVLDDHLAIMQSQGLRSGRFEQHLSWLLRQAGAEHFRLRLIDQPPKDVRQNLEKSAVKALVLGGELMSPPRDRSNENTWVKGEISGKDGSGPIFAALRFLAGVDRAAQLGLDALSQNANIEYSLKIHYKKSTTEDGQRLMNTLGVALRHAEDVKTMVVLKDGSKIKGEQLRLSGRVSIKTHNGIPDSSDVFTELCAWLMQKLKSGDVEASLMP
jgi:hypothetical protein